MAHRHATIITPGDSHGSIILCLLFSVIALLPQAHTQDYVLESEFYGVEEGLSQRNVHCIHQDQSGFLWIGTDYGLNRFDGYSFDWFTKEKNGLASNKINAILEDTKGVMWLLDVELSRKKKISSITLFNPITHATQSIEDRFGEALPFTPSEIVAFTQNIEGHLLFISQSNQLFTYTDHWSVIELSPLSYSILREVHWSPSGQYWLVTEDEKAIQTLLVFDIEGKLIAEDHDGHSSYIHLYDLQEDGSGRYFKVSQVQEGVHAQASASFYKMSANGTVKRDNNTRWRDLDVRFHEMHGRASFLESDHLHWFYSDFPNRNLVVVDKNSGQVVQNLSDDTPRFKSTNALLLDRSGAVWVGTPFGVHRLHFKENLFQMHLAKQETTSNLFSCRQIVADSAGLIWVRVERPKGIWIIDNQTGDELDSSQPHGEMDPLPTVSNTNYAIIRTSDNKLISSLSQDLLLINPQTRAYELTDTKLTRRAIWAYYEDALGKVWFHDQSHNEFGYLEHDSVTILPIKLGEDQNPYVYQFYEVPGSTDTVWLVTSAGLYTFDLKREQILNRYWSGGEGDYYFPHDNLHHLYADSDSTYWLSTAVDGMVQVDLSSTRIQVLTQYTRADGLPGNGIYAIYGDEYDHLWISTDNGIARYDKETQQFTGFTEADGIANNEFNRVSHFQDERGRIYFGGLNGITSFHPKDFQEEAQSLHPPMVISSFQQFDGGENKLVDKLGELRQKQTIVLKPNDRFFRLEFALLDFRDNTMDLYAYKIEGLDEDWNYQADNVLRVSRLPYGEYTLRIKGQTVSGQWSNQEIAIQLQIRRPFYLQLWFIVLSILSLIALTVGIFRWRLYQLKAYQTELKRQVADRTHELEEDKKTIRQQAEELKSLEELKSRFFANVSHELRTPITLMLGPVNSMLKRRQIEDEETKLLQLVQRNGMQLQKLVNEILDLAKLEDNRLEISEEPVLLLPYLNDQLAQFRTSTAQDQQRISLIFQADSSLTVLLDKSKFEKIIHNYLSNAIKFTGIDGQITLSVFDLGDELQISVRDTGRGIHAKDLPHVFDRFYQREQSNEQPQGGTGIGLSLVKELAELLEGRVWAESKVGVGSTFYFQLPKKETEEVEETPAPPSNVPQELISTPTVAGHPAPTEVDKATILIVEDNADLREYLNFVLSDYHIHLAEHGHAALAELEAPNPVLPDLIISDLMMPIMDGYQLLRTLKADDRWRHIPTIMLTAKVNIRSKLEALRIGVDDYLTKPFQEDELRARIENLLRNVQERLRYQTTDANVESAEDDSKKPTMASVDADWLQEVEQVFYRHLADNRLTVDFVAQHLNLSERQFHRRLKKLTGLTPNHYLREIRLQKAKDLLIEGQFTTVKEVAFNVGFNNVPYFSNLFFQHFGVKPSSLKS